MRLTWHPYLVVVLCAAAARGRQIDLARTEDELQYAALVPGGAAAGTCRARHLFTARPHPHHGDLGQLRRRRHGGESGFRLAAVRVVRPSDTLHEDMILACRTGASYAAVPLTHSRC